MSGILQLLRCWRRAALQNAKFALVIGLWVAIGGTPAKALAQSDADRATARNLAAEGYTALKTQDYATAEDRFRRADALVHAPTLVVDHARALIGLGRFVEAQERLELVVREGVADNAPWVWKKAVTEAGELVNQVKPKVAWLTITVSGPNDPLVLVDGKQVPVAALGVRRAVDPGPRRISATANGYLPKEISLAMPEGGERAVTLDLSLDPGITPVRPKLESKHKENPLLRSNPEKKPSNTLAYSALGLGGVGLVVGTVSGILALGKRSELMDKCGGSRVCTYGDNFTLAEQTRLVDDYRRYGTVSGIGLGVGALGTAVGVWLLVSNRPKESPQRPTQASVVPYVSIGDVGLRGAF